MKDVGTDECSSGTHILQHSRIFIWEKFALFTKWIGKIYLLLVIFIREEFAIFREIFTPGVAQIVEVWSWCLFVFDIEFEVEK